MASAASLDCENVEMIVQDILQKHANDAGSARFDDLPHIDPQLFHQDDGRTPPPHATYKMVTIHTAKCDLCKNRNAATIYRCADCAAQICTPCAEVKCSVAAGPLSWDGTKHDVFKAAYLAMKAGGEGCKDDGTYEGHGVRLVKADSLKKVRKQVRGTTSSSLSTTQKQPPQQQREKREGSAQNENSTMPISPISGDTTLSVKSEVLPNTPTDNDNDKKNETTKSTNEVMTVSERVASNPPALSSASASSTRSSPSESTRVTRSSSALAAASIPPASSFPPDVPFFAPTIAPYQAPESAIRTTLDPNYQGRPSGDPKVSSPEDTIDSSPLPTSSPPDVSPKSNSSSSRRSPKSRAKKGPKVTKPRAKRPPRFSISQFPKDVRDYVLQCQKSSKEKAAWLDAKLAKDKENEFLYASDDTDTDQYEELERKASIRRSRAARRNALKDARGGDKHDMDSDEYKGLETRGRARRRLVQTRAAPPENASEVHKEQIPTNLVRSPQLPPKDEQKEDVEVGRSIAGVRTESERARIRKAQAQMQAAFAKLRKQKAAAPALPQHPPQDFAQHKDDERDTTISEGLSSESPQPQNADAIILPDEPPAQHQTVDPTILPEDLPYNFTQHLEDIQNAMATSPLEEDAAKEPQQQPAVRRSGRKRKRTVAYGEQEEEEGGTTRDAKRARYRPRGHAITESSSPEGNVITRATTTSDDTTTTTSDQDRGFVMDKDTPPEYRAFIPPRVSPDDDYEVGRDVEEALGTAAVHLKNASEADADVLTQISSQDDSSFGLGSEEDSAHEPALPQQHVNTVEGDNGDVPQINPQNNSDLMLWSEHDAAFRSAVAELLHDSTSDGYNDVPAQLTTQDDSGLGLMSEENSPLDSAMLQYHDTASEADAGVSMHDDKAAPQSAMAQQHDSTSEANGDVPAQFTPTNNTDFFKCVLK